MKIVKYGEPGCSKTEAEGSAKYIQFMFDQFKSRGHGHTAELYNDDGRLIASKSFGVTETFR